MDIPVQEEIKIAIRNAVEHFRNNGLDVKRAPIGSMQELTECGLAKFFTIKDIPLILRNTENPKKKQNVYLEMLKCAAGQSDYSFAGLFFSFLYETHGLIQKKNIAKYVQLLEKYRQQFLVCEMLKSIQFHSVCQVDFFSQSNVALCVFDLMRRKCSAMTVYSSIQRTQQRLFVIMIHI